MLELLKDEDLITLVGGRFRLTALIQKRWRELLLGARPMIEPGDMTPLEIVVQEIHEGKISFKDMEVAATEDA